MILPLSLYFEPSLSHFIIIFEGVPQGTLEINVANLIGTGPIRMWKTLDKIFDQLEQKYNQTNTVLIQCGGRDTKTCEGSLVALPPYNKRAALHDDGEALVHVQTYIEQMLQGVKDFPGGMPEYLQKMKW